MILDAGFLVSVDRGDTAAKTFLNAAARQQWALVTTEPVIAQVWRRGQHQARLAKFLNSIRSVPLDDGREVGALLAASTTSDPIDAHLVLSAARLRQPILTGDLDDISLLCGSLGNSPPKIYRWPGPVGSPCAPGCQ